MKFNDILAKVDKYYTGKLIQNGASPQGVDWKSADSQELRFIQLLKLCNENNPFSINDYGCGYGALIDFLLKKEVVFEYHGFDISDGMISKATELHGNMPFCHFYNREELLPVSDYTIASGIFNVKLDSAEKEWSEYILDTLSRISNSCKLGFAFNVLTKYSDKPFMRPDLFYADPLFLFDYCKINFSKYVSLLHDYPLYEFTIIVRKSPEN